MFTYRNAKTGETVHTNHKVGGKLWEEVIHEESIVAPSDDTFDKEPIAEIPEEPAGKTGKKPSGRGKK